MFVIALAETVRAVERLLAVLSLRGEMLGNREANPWWQPNIGLDGRLPNQQCYPIAHGESRLPTTPGKGASMFTQFNDHIDVDATVWRHERKSDKTTAATGPRLQIKTEQCRVLRKHARHYHCGPFPFGESVGIAEEPGYRRQRQSGTLGQQSLRRRKLAPSTMIPRSRKASMNAARTV